MHSQQMIATRKRMAELQGEFQESMKSAAEQARPAGRWPGAFLRSSLLEPAVMVGVALAAGYWMAPMAYGARLATRRAPSRGWKGAWFARQAAVSGVAWLVVRRLSTGLARRMGRAVSRKVARIQPEDIAPLGLPRSAAENSTAKNLTAKNSTSRNPATKNSATKSTSDAREIPPPTTRNPKNHLGDQNDVNHQE
jgi:hypothetical protein